MKSKLAVAIILLCVAQSRGLSDQNFGRIAFKAGEKFLSDGNLDGAYNAFSAALDADPKNTRFAKKRAEVGTELSAQDLAKAKALSQKDPTSAYEWVQKALRLNPSDEVAIQTIQESRMLEQQAAAALRALEDASIAVRDGNAEKAKGLLASASKFRRWSWKPEHGSSPFDLVTSELEGLNRALRVRDLAEEGKTEQAVEELLIIRPAEDASSFARRSLADTRRNVIKSLLEQTRSKALDDITAYSERTRLLRTASKLDDSDPAIKQVRLETITGFGTLLSKTTQPEFKNQHSADRFHLAIREATAEMFGETYIPGSHSLSSAYPALRVSVRLNDPHSCLTPNDRNNLEAEIIRALSPVATANGSSWDLEVSISDIACSDSDIPRVAARSANSTYVAGKTQLSNPAYVQLQSTLASAEANLNRAVAVYQANPTLANSFFQIAAANRVRRVRTELANTAPYSDSNIVQAYQYDIFEASRSVAFKSLVAVRANPTVCQYAVVKEITSVREDRKEGVSGVLPNDRSSVANIEPVLRSIQELTAESQKSFCEKTISAIKWASAGFYALQASDNRELDGERLSAMLYLSDLAEGTEYQEDAEGMRARFKRGVELDPGVSQN